MYLCYTIYKNGHILDNEKINVGDKDVREVINYLQQLRISFAKENNFDWERTKFGKSTDGYWISYKYGDENHCLIGEL